MTKHGFLLTNHVSFSTNVFDHGLLPA